MEQPTLFPTPRKRIVPLPTEKSQPALFGAVAEACGWDLGQLTKSARGRVGRAVQELVPLEVTVAEVAARARRYRELYPGASLTPQALVGNWAGLAPPAPGSRQPREIRVCAQCRGVVGVDCSGLHAVSEAG